MRLAVGDADAFVWVGRDAPSIEADDAGTRAFHCAFDPSCPEVALASPFRGYGDPSIERDPDTGTLWLSYSWLEARVEGTASPIVITDFDLAAKPPRLVFSLRATGVHP